MRLTREDLDSLGAQVSEVLGTACTARPWRQGSQYHALRVTARGGEYVLRVPLAEHSPDFDGVTDYAEVVTRESRFHQVLEQAGIPLARLVAWKPRSADSPRSWMLLERVTNDEATSLNPSQQRELGAAARRVHSVPCQDLGVGPGGPGRPTEMLKRIQVRYQVAESVLSLPSWTILESAIMPAFEDGLDQERLCIVHMDLRPPNLCYRGNRLVALLDITNAMVASAYADLGRLWANQLLSADFLLGYELIPTEHDSFRILAYAIDTLTMLIALTAYGRVDRRLLSSVGPRLVQVCTAMTAQDPDPSTLLHFGSR